MLFIFVAAFMIALRGLDRGGLAEKTEGTEMRDGVTLARLKELTICDPAKVRFHLAASAALREVKVASVGKAL